MEPILQCQGLTKRFGTLFALANVNLNIYPGRITGLLGPNGSGKTTLIKIANGLLTPDAGTLTINGMQPGVATKSVVSYLPERTYLAPWMKVCDIIDYFKDFYADFDEARAYDMLRSLNINPNDRLKTMSKGTREKVQLILVMSRRAQLYILDEPIAGVDPAARDYILNTVIKNYDRNAAIILSTHLITDVENILDDVIFIRYGQIVEADSADNLRSRSGMTIDQHFREVFRC